MQKINLKVKEGNTVSTEQVEIGEVTIQQIASGLKTGQKIIDYVQNDEDLQSVLSGMFEPENEDEEFAQYMFRSLAGSLDTLLIHIPELVIQLLSDLSGVDYELIMQQPAVEALDIYDAIIEVNDIDKLITRGKKSLEYTKRLNLFQKGQKKVQEAQEADKQQ